MTTPSSPTPVRQAVDIAINLALIFLILAWCLQILSPFIGLLAWGAVLAVSLYTPFLKLTNALGNRKKLALTIFVVLGLVIVVVPAWLFADSMISGAKTVVERAEAGTLTVPPPTESVRQWPLVGQKVYDTWHEASTNLRSFLSTHSDQVTEISRQIFARTASTGLGILQFIVSVFIAAAFLAYAGPAQRGFSRLSERLAGPRGDKLLDLSIRTVRSVTVGVLGIAALQALMGGLGMFFVGVPGTGIWTVAILILAIAQLPPWLVLLPIIIYVFSQESTAVATVFMIWSLVVSFSDVVLKPMLLGRGLEVPMLVILIGAIGGMIMSGILGLFIGAVVFALGYELFEDWLESGEGTAFAAEPEPAADVAAAESSPAE